MSDAKQHMNEFRLASEMLDSLPGRVREAMDTWGCDEALVKLKQGAYFLGNMDAHYDATPKGHPVRKAFLAQMKKGQTSLARAKTIFEKRCAWPQARGKRRRR